MGAWGGLCTKEIIKNRVMVTLMEVVRRECQDGDFSRSGWFQYMEAHLVPGLGKEFDDLEEAWRFYNEYACEVGFSARKNELTKSMKDKKTIISYRYVCSKEGKRKPDKRCTSTTNHRSETRTYCQAGMTVKLVEGEGQTSITTSSMSHQFLVGESTMFNQHEAFGNQHL